jgi:hypothetical protein
VSCGDEEQETNITIPPVVRVTVIGVEPPTVVVTVDTEKVQVAVRVSYVERTASATTP